MASGVSNRAYCKVQGDPVVANIVAVNSMRRCAMALSRVTDERILLHCIASVALEMASPTTRLELAAHSEGTCAFVPSLQHERW